MEVLFREFEILVDFRTLEFVFDLKDDLLGNLNKIVGEKKFVRRKNCKAKIFKGNFIGWNLLFGESR